MTHITIRLDEATEARMRRAAQEYGRRVEELAELAVAEAALEVYRHLQDDPAKTLQKEFA